jgi:transcription elongation factor Elf1
MKPCVITGGLCTGCGECKPGIEVIHPDALRLSFRRIYTCPACERELASTATVYRHASGEIVGCEFCVRGVEAAEVEGMGL